MDTPILLSATVLGLPHDREHPYEFVGLLPGRPRLAIVGSRAAHRRVLRTLPAIVEAAGARGWSVVSGGALGIDGGAHRAALDLGIPQLAVLPCGRDRLYPPAHVPMFQSMIDSNRAGLLFAHPPGTEPARQMFASRNGIIVALADALLVAEAGLRSGSCGTGMLALRRGLPVAALAGSSGCGALIGAGARAIPVLDTTDELAASVGAWLDVLGGAPTDTTAAKSAWPEHLAWLERLIPRRRPGRGQLRRDARLCQSQRGAVRSRVTGPRV